MIGEDNHIHTSHTRDDKHTKSSGDVMLMSISASHILRYMSSTVNVSDSRIIVKFTIKVNR